MNSNPLKASFVVFCTVLFGTAGVLTAGTATITYSAQETGSALGGIDGTELPIGSLVRFGYFDPVVDIAASWGNISLLDSSFTELGRTLTGHFNGNTTWDETGMVTSSDIGQNFGVPGAFAASVTLDAAALGNTTTRMYIWAFDSSTVAAATAHAVFSDAAWTIGAKFTATFEVSAVNPSDPTDIYLAQLGPETSPNVTGLLNKLIAVPEPSALLFSLLGLGSLVFSRRRL